MYKYLFYLFLAITQLFANPIYREDDANKISINKRVKGSHINVYIPTMPYLYVSKLINGTLLRSKEYGEGWEYMLATKCKRKNELEYIFTLRKNVKFQDGTNFTADDVIYNFKSILKDKLGSKLLINYVKDIQKISTCKIKFILKKPNELFLNILTRYNIYSKKYIDKYTWGLKGETANSMKVPGEYGLGPYILKKGYAVGREQSPIIQLVANPYYYEKAKPYIENITIYTELSTKEVLNKILKESTLDIAVIPFNKKVETIISSHSKLITLPSKNSISILMNMIKANGILQNQKIRLALNEAINQKKLLKFVYKKEGQISPTTINPNLYLTEKTFNKLPSHREKLEKRNINKEKYLKNILNGLKLNVVTMDRLMFLWKGIEYQLGLYGVKLNYTIVKSEKKLFDLFFNNRKKPQTWDLLSWNSDAWANNNPWNVFFHYKIGSSWSAINEDLQLEKYLDKFLKSKFKSKEFTEVTYKIINHVYNKAYMLAVPAPNIVLAVNKELDYTPSSILLMPLWEAKLTPYHWSIRKGNYPKERLIPIKPKREKYGKSKD